MMKMRKFLYVTLCLCVTMLLACNPDEKENTSPDNPDVENPDNPNNPDTPDRPDRPSGPAPIIPEDDGGSYGTPGGDIDEPGDNTEEAKVLYERDFTKVGVDLSAYQMIDVDGVEIVSPAYESGWSFWAPSSSVSQRILLSFMGSPKDEHDHWLITEGFYLDNSTSKAILSWKMSTGYYDESYEVYISTSPDKASFVEKVYDGIAPHIADGDSEHLDILLDKYQGQTIYIAFRHNTPSAKNRWTLILESLKIVTFPYDDVDLQTDKLWLTYPNFVVKGSTLTTGRTYPPELELNVNMAVKNFGLGLRNETLTFSYKYDDEVIIEEVPGISLPNGETYVHTFKKKLMTKDGAATIRPISVSVKPLTGETRIKKNSRYVDITHLKGDPEYHMLFEKYAKTACQPCGLIFYVFDDLEKAYPNRTIGLVTMQDAGLNLPDADLSAAYHWWITNCIGWGTYATPVTSYNREKGNIVNPPSNFTSLMTDGTFAERMFPPFAIQVKHDFSEDGKTMYVHLEVTCLLDQENVDLGLSAIIAEDNITEYPWQLGVTNNKVSVRDHLVRTFLGGDEIKASDNVKLGSRNVIPSTTKAGEKYNCDFEYTIPEKIGKHTLDLTQLYAVGLIIKEDKKILNSNKSTKTAATK